MFRVTVCKVTFSKSLKRVGSLKNHSIKVSSTRWNGDIATHNIVTFPFFLLMFFVTCVLGFQNNTRGYHRLPNAVGKCTAVLAKNKKGNQVPYVSKPENIREYEVLTSQLCSLNFLGKATSVTYPIVTTFEIFFAGKKTHSNSNFRGKTLIRVCPDKTCELNCQHRIAAAESS